MTEEQTQPRFYFYLKNGKPEVTLTFEPESHTYFRVMPNGDSIPQDNVTSVLHGALDKSMYLTAWAAKMAVEKMFRVMPRNADNPEMTAAVPLSEFRILLEESKKAHKEKLTDAGECGTAAHQCIEDSINAAIKLKKYSEQSPQVEGAIVEELLNLPEDPRALNACNAALSWMRSHNVRWLRTERKIFSLKYSYCGTLDGLCIVDACNNVLCCAEKFKDRLSVADWKTSNQMSIDYLYQTAAYEAAYEEEFDVDIKDRWILRLGKEDGEFGEPWHLTAADFADDFKAFLYCLALVRQHKSVTARMSERGKLRTKSRRTAKASEKQIAEEQERLQKALAKEEGRLAKLAAKTAADEEKFFAKL